MAWTEITRDHHRRVAQCHASDLTDRESALVSVFLPKSLKMGRPRKTSLKSVFEVIL